MADNKVTSEREARTFHDYSAVQARADRDRDRYWARKRSPRARNIGPFSRRGNCEFHAYLVVTTVSLPKGAVINGCRVPEGSRLDGVLLAPPFHSRGQARKAASRLRRKHASVSLRETWSVFPIDRTHAPSLVPPADAPANWWRGLSEGNAAAPVPRISVPWGAGKGGAA